MLIWILCIIGTVVIYIAAAAQFNKRVKNLKEDCNKDDDG